MKDKMKFTDILIIILMFIAIVLIDILFAAIVVKILSWAFCFHFKWRYVVGFLVIFLVLKMLVSNSKKDN